MEYSVYMKIDNTWRDKVYEDGIRVEKVLFEPGIQGQLHI